MPTPATLEGSDNPAGLRQNCISKITPRFFVSLLPILFFLRVLSKLALPLEHRRADLRPEIRVEFLAQRGSLCR